MKSALLFCVVSVAAIGAQPSPYAKLPQVPVGIAASSDSRVFVSFSRAIDPAVTLSVAEVIDGTAKSFPPGFEQGEGPASENRLLSVQSVYVDARDRLWMLDTGKVGTKPVAPGTPKLVAYDLKQNKVAHRISFPAGIAGAESFLNDLRVDLGRGAEGTIYLTDAAPKGPNALVVVDIASGQAVRKLENDVSVRPDASITLTVEGKQLIQLRGPDKGKPFVVGADGIALSPDGKYLYYSPLTSHRLYRVNTDALVEADAVAAVEDLGDKGFANDGLWMDGDGRLYATDFESGAVKRRLPDGGWELLARGGAVSWPDSFAQLPDGRLLFTATQIHRSDRFRSSDQRVKPFQILSMPVDARPRVGRRPEPAR